MESNSHFAKLPKADLHAHAVLSAPFRIYQRFSENLLPEPPDRFESLLHFLTYARSTFIPLFTSLHVFREILGEALDHMIRDSVVYTELSFDVAFSRATGLSWPEIIEGLREEIELRKRAIVVRPELGLNRETPEGSWEKPIEEALSQNFFEGVDLYGDEDRVPAREFARFFERARAKGLKIKLHIGETSTPSRLIEEVLLIKPDAVQHGVRAAEDPRAVELLANLGIAVNICPTSNVKLAVVRDYVSHPIRALFDGGVKVTVNSDDYAVFGASVTDEFEMLLQNGIFTKEELEMIRKNGLSESGELIFS